MSINYPEIKSKFDELIRQNESEGEIVFDPKAERIPDLMNVLPKCPFDIEFSDKCLQQQKAQAIYKVRVVNSITDNLYDSEIKAIVSSGYNFKYLKAIDVEMPFAGLLKLITEDKNLVITLILNALTCILSEQRQLICRHRVRRRCYTTRFNKKTSVFH